MRMECAKCGRRNIVVREISKQERRRILYPECKIERKRE